MCWRCRGYMAEGGYMAEEGHKGVGNVDKAVSHQHELYLKFLVTSSLFISKWVLVKGLLQHFPPNNSIFFVQFNLLYQIFLFSH